MLLKLFSRITIAAAIISLLGLAAWGQGEKKWKDRAEYDVYSAILKENDPAKKLELLEAYKKKYPTTDYEQERLLMFTQAYQATKQPEKMYASAQELLKLDENNVQALYYLTSLTTTMQKTDAQFLANGEKYGQALVAALPKLPKPQNMSAADFQKQKDGLELVARTALAWVAMTRKNNVEAESRYRKVLDLNPNNGQASYHLASVILAQRDPKKQSEAFYHFARAGNYTGEGAMPAAGRRQVSDYLKKIYVSFHGSEEGLDDLIAMSLKSAKAPAGLEIKSKEVLEAEADQKLAKEQPELYMWLGIKKQLENDPTYFDTKMKNTRVQGLRGYLVSQTPAERPKTLVVALSDKSSREVTLVLDTPYKYAARRGTVLRFEGVPTNFTKQPFMLTMNVEQEKLRGWPPPPQRRQTR